MHLAKDARQELVCYLSAEGMSTRAIALIVGVTQKTVVKDTQVIPEVSPETTVAAINREASTSAVLIARTVGVSSISPVQQTHDANPSKVLGIDGKEYTRPERKTVTVGAMNLGLTHVARILHEAGSLSGEPASDYG